MPLHIRGYMSRRHPSKASGECIEALKQRLGAAVKTQTAENSPTHTKGVFSNSGHCYCCDQDVEFVAESDWFRDHYKCTTCGSIPRERALMWCIETFFPNWRRGIVHESSPVARGASLKLREKAGQYIESQYFVDVDPGTRHRNTRCENLEHLTFSDESIDLHVTQDVLEHVFAPDRAFQEIARTLKPGGMHIFTVPLVNKEQPTQVAARRRSDGSIQYLVKPEYHGNPVSDQGSLVTIRWGYDICEYIFQASGLFTQMVYLDVVDWGIRADLIEVLITRKPESAQLAPGGLVGVKGLNHPKRS